MKLNWKNLIILIFGVLCFVLFMVDWFVIIFQGATFTTFGLLINIAKMIGFVGSFDYLEDYLERK